MAHTYFHVFERQNDTFFYVLQNNKNNIQFYNDAFTFHIIHQSRRLSESSSSSSSFVITNFFLRLFLLSFFSPF